MFWLATVSVVRGELPQGLEAIADLPSAAQERGNRPALLNGIRGQGMILMFMGRLVESREALDRAIELFNTSQEADRIAARAAGQDAGVAMLVLMAWVLSISAKWMTPFREWPPRLNAPMRSNMRIRTLTPGTTHLFCTLCAASGQSLRATRNAVSPYRSNTGSATGLDCRARSETSTRWMKAADSTR